MRSLSIILAAGILAACGNPSDENAQATESAPDSTVQTLEYLSSDLLGGRRTGEPGNLLAQDHIIERLSAIGVAPWSGGYRHPFNFVTTTQEGDETAWSGTNIVGLIEGVGANPSTIVISAHYDHVGTRGDEVFNGADDNASGVAGLLAVAEEFKTKAPQNNILVVFFDAEELGLRGARAFIEMPEVTAVKPALNINFDMISRSDKDELYAAGAFHTPALGPILKSVADEAPVKLKMGHDDPALGSNDWTSQSDQGPFHQAGIPFVYFGVEDHPHYHRPSDDFATVPIDFFKRSVETVKMAARTLDSRLAEIQ
jgi:Zn-dependent M28 family amino/carboxypeptidase